MAELIKSNRKYKSIEMKLRKMQSDIEFLIQDIHALHYNDEVLEDREDKIKKLILSIYDKMYGDTENFIQIIEERALKKSGAGYGKKNKIARFIQVICYIFFTRKICSQATLTRIFKIDRAAPLYYNRVVPGYLETDIGYRETYAIINSLIYAKQ